MAHGDRQQRLMLTRTNACAWCDWIFTNRRALIEHLKARRSSDHCPRPTLRSRAEMHHPYILRCPRCNWQTTELTKWNAHVRAYAYRPSCILDQGNQHGGTEREDIREFDTEHEAVGGEPRAGAHAAPSRGGRKSRPRQGIRIQPTTNLQPEHQRDCTGRTSCCARQPASHCRQLAKHAC